MVSFRSLAEPKNKKKLVVFVIGILLVSVGVWLAHTQQANTSDDVAIQTIFSQHLRLPGNGVAWLGEDNYILKVPFYLLTDGLFGTTRTTLFISALVFNTVAFGLFFYSTHYFYKRFRGRSSFLDWALVWLASTSYFYVMLFLVNPNQRNLEAGLYFFILMLVAKYTNKELSFDGAKRWGAAGLALLCSLFLYSDAFFIFMLVLPLLIFFGLQLYFGRFDRRLLYAGGFLVASVALSFGWRVFFESFGILVRKPDMHFVLLDQLWQTIQMALEGYFRFFAADFWGQVVQRPETIRLLLNALVLIATFWAIFLIFRWQRRDKKRDLWLGFWAAQPLFMTFIYLINSNTISNSDGSHRFLVMIPFFAPLLLAVMVDRLKNHRLVIMLFVMIILACTFNVGALIKKASQLSGAPNANGQNMATIHTIEGQHLSKGFGNYWDSTINTYLSRGRVTVIPAICDGIQHFLMNDKTLALPAKTSFYIYNPTLMVNCSEAKLAETFGLPTRVMPLEGGRSLLIYDYDITDKIRPGYYYQAPPTE